LLTGSTKAKMKKEILQKLEAGEIDILIGTHALIEDKVKFKNLGFVVIDEQHRFGVEQRSRLWNKGVIAPHVLVMTATPIPRTLAMTLYGDLDISIIDELPPGRKPVQTIHRFETDRLRLWGSLRKEIAAGRQVYIVYPLIEESEKMDMNNLMEGYESICRDFPRPEFNVSIVHGKMKPADKSFEMQRFIKKETQIMVATTVIEVGVNVPNASLMVIENAERFGLSQLHQLRGRVGRGADQSYCILVSKQKLSNEARLRIRTRQSGMLDLKLSDISRDQQIVMLARDTVIKLLKEDPGLKAEKNDSVSVKLNEILKSKGEWGRIG
jgi:ATP-dependent DNA helicase RecG